MVFLISDLESILHVARFFLFHQKLLSLITKLLETLGHEEEYLLLLADFSQREI